MKAVIIGAAIAAMGTAALAEPTRVVIRAQAADAKFIGDHMGGVKVALREARTRKVLAEGNISGGTGNTARIMQTPHARNAAIADASTAGFEAVLDLAAPTLVEAEVMGPLGKPASAIKVVSQRWIVPGRDIVGDGWILPFSGLVVDVDTSNLAAAKTLNATVTLMCGCPIEPGGLWPAEDYEVMGEFMRDGKLVRRIPLAYAGASSRFSADIAALGPGAYDLRVVSNNSKTANAGVWEGKVRIGP